jgi:hypothetical protein
MNENAPIDYMKLMIPSMIAGVIGMVQQIMPPAQ